MITSQCLQENPTYMNRWGKAKRILYGEDTFVVGYRFYMGHSRGVLLFGMNFLYGCNTS